MTTVYTKANCVQCEMTKKFLDKNNLPYEVVDIEKDKSALEKVLAWGFASAPVVATATDKWAGFKLDKLNELAA